MPEREPQDVLVVCNACAAYCTFDHFSCGRDPEADWCPSCFPKTACGNKQHGPWCARRFTDAELAHARGRLRDRAEPPASRRSTRKTPGMDSGGALFPRAGRAANG